MSTITTIQEIVIFSQGLSDWKNDDVAMWFAYVRSVNQRKGYNMSKNVKDQLRESVQLRTRL